MVGCGILMFLGLRLGHAGCSTGGSSTPRSGSSDWRCPPWLLPFIANATGWIFTEMGRQPWVVYGLLKTAKGVSPIGTGYVVTTLVGFTAIYSILAIIDFGLMARYAKLDPDSVDEHGQAKPTGEDGRPSERRRASTATPSTTTTGSRPSSTERERATDDARSPRSHPPTPDSRSSGS